MKSYVWLKTTCVVVILAAAFVLNGCSNPEPAGPTGWAGLKTKDEKLTFMGTKIFSPMQKLFTEHNKERYKEFACETCHGKDMKEKKYAMPNIKPLDPANMPKGSTATFMREKVMPEFAKILGKELYDDKTKKGFGCFSCHTKKAK